METKLQTKPGQKRKASPRPKTITKHGKKKEGRGFKVFDDLLEVVHTTQNLQQRNFKNIS
ncbi:hypothetical protein E3E23_06430 [Thermococcus sp. CX2]|uniref:hypothetical protein n=1 Tax=Thermococcus sp. CX2 TaxID=163006 RepID=UPI00143CA544|nr:hypothetical protein [Thermococcus sp. CX2]NJE85459.1 hypothetical protein [Thermococcus sp. CX2]